jgi:hypothetical protein
MSEAARGRLCDYERRRLYGDVDRRTGWNGGEVKNREKI